MIARSRTLVVLALALVALAGPAAAVVCAPDNVPAATLLVPHFEVDLAQCANPDERRDTRYSIGNVAAHPVLAGVTFWSNWGVPITGFQLYLPGLSSQTITLGDFFCDGTLPQTGAGVSPHPPGTDPPVSFPICNDGDVPGDGPNYELPAAPEYFLEHVRASLTGAFSDVYGAYVGQAFGDEIARGYLTVDVLNQCHLLFPNAPGYFVAGGFGIAADDNVLVGDYTVTQPANNFAFAQPAVALEAEDLDFLPGDLTFYGRYVSVGLTGSDGREPLPSTFASTFAVAGAFETTDQVIWRERAAVTGSASPLFPNDLPLNEANVTWFDLQSTPYLSYIPPGLPGEPVLELVDYLFPSHSYSPADVSYPVPVGWQYSRLQTAQLGYPEAGQAWIVTRTQALGRYETARPAVALDSSCVNQAFTPQNLTVTTTGALAENPPTVLLAWADFEDFFAGWSEVEPF